MGFPSVITHNMSNRMFQIPGVQKIVADAAAAASVTSATWTWVAQANEALQLIATLIAIVSGIYALKFHMGRNDDDED